jgi:hypothetical protein
MSTQSIESKRRYLENWKPSGAAGNQAERRTQMLEMAAAVAHERFDGDG